MYSPNESSSVLLRLVVRLLHYFLSLTCITWRPSDHELTPLAVGCQVPPEYILVVPHPNSGRQPYRISLDGEPLEAPSSRSRPHESSFKAATSHSQKPWFPFPSLADFSFTRSTVRHGLHAAEIDNDLRELHNVWTKPGGSNVTLNNHRDRDKYLAIARKMHGMPFERITLEDKFMDKTCTFTFDYRDPWEWLKLIFTDKTLADFIVYHSERKYYCWSDGSRVRLFDEPNTGTAWGEIDDELTCDERFSHIFAALHVWIDEGMVTRHLTKQPVLLRNLNLPSSIFNGSGNGGSFFLGLLSKIKYDGDWKQLSELQQLEFGRFRRVMEQKLLDAPLGKLRKRSHDGEGLRCSDNEIRVLHPGILIESFDAKQAAQCTCTRGHMANHPCPMCNVDVSQLREINRDDYEARTSKMMAGIFGEANKHGTKTALEQILKDYGMHNVKLFLWEHRFSDPYRAYRYDKLHSCDEGIWGKHLYELLLKVLAHFGRTTDFTQKYPSIDNVPRWSGLKHFKNVVGDKIHEGNGYMDILRNSKLVHCVRACLELCMMQSMDVMSGYEDDAAGQAARTARRPSRLAKAEEFRRDYQAACDRHPDGKIKKTFAFLKQHLLNHALNDIREAGALRNFSTRLGEGFHQELSELFRLTNKRDADEQIDRHDMDREAVAHMETAIQAYWDACKV
ncbi:hypothetical protein PENSPDRAFT_590638 [Peniophora sp. CONT]|nr:hypothetical protein PENSPDRAFT_590638 [Peniophora sp. CONT]